MLTRLDKFPAPYFAGKTDAAPAVWTALGDPASYVEPFCGSLVVLLRRPALANRTYYSETVNDCDGLLVNAIRSIQLHPQETAEAASWPVVEADLHARHLAIVRFAAERDLEKLMGDPHWCDPEIGGWWLWGASCWIGTGFASGTGPWILGDDGRITRRAGTEHGVSRQIPHAGHDGKGVNHAECRESGVKRQRPFVSSGGRSVNHPGCREPGVAGQPFPSTDIASPQEDWRDAVEADYADTGGYHPMTMPELRRWFAWLSARLRHVRVLNGAWMRAVTPAVVKTLPVRMGDKVAGLFLDPPYSAAAGRDPDIYVHDDLDVAVAAREWAISNGDDPELRIVFAGFEGEHGTAFADAGWREVEWFKSGFLKGGMGQQSVHGHKQHRERLWLSPHCLSPGKGQLDLWTT